MPQYRNVAKEMNFMLRNNRLGLNLAGAKKTNLAYCPDLKFGQDFSLLVIKHQLGSYVMSYYCILVYFRTTLAIRNYILLLHQIHATMPYDFEEKNRKPKTKLPII